MTVATIGAAMSMIRAVQEMATSTTHASTGQLSVTDIYTDADKMENLKLTVVV